MQLHRSLTRLDACSLLISCIVGSGIFVTPGLILSEVGGAPGVLLLCFAVGSVVGGCSGFLYAELACLLPSAGGDYTYIKTAFGESLAFSYSFCMFFVRAPGAHAFNALTLARYILPTIGAIISGFDTELGDNALLEKTIALSSILLVVVLNCFRLQVVSRMMNALAALKLLLVAFLAFVMVMTLARSTEVLRSNFSAPFRGANADGLGVAMVTVMWSCAGYGNIAFMVEEMADPMRDIGPSILMTCAAVSGIIFSSLMSYFAVLPIPQIEKSTAIAMDASRGVAGDSGAAFVAFLIAFSIVGSNFGATMANGRFVYATARDGQFPKFLARMSKDSVPIWSVLAYGIWCMVLASLPGATLSNLLMYLGGVAWFFDVIVVLALVRLRWTMPMSERPFRMPLYPLPALILISVGAYMCVSALILHPVSAGTGMAFVVVSFPIHRFIVRKGTDDGCACPTATVDTESTPLLK